MEASELRLKFSTTGASGAIGAARDLDTQVKNVERDSHGAASGLGGMFKAAAGLAAGVGIAPHNPLGPLAGVAALHFDIATPNFVIQEEMSGAVPWYHDVVHGPIRRVDGYWQIPDQPGLGVEVDEKEIAKHPFKQEVMHAGHAMLDDGTVVDW